jgi:hypothetical protein
VAYVAILEDDARQQERMLELLPEFLPRLTPIVFDNAPEMIAWLPDNPDEVSLICLDHDLGPRPASGGHRPQGVALFKKLGRSGGPRGLRQCVRHADLARTRRRCGDDRSLSHRKNAFEHLTVPLGRTSRDSR